MVLGLILWSCCAGAQEPRRPLPVYIEDNHAGTFQFLASALELEQPHVLVLIDAHADAAINLKAKVLQEGIRQAALPQERYDRMTAWRKDGTLQASNWLTPLMPKPIKSVLWVRPPDLPGDPDQKLKDLDLLRLRLMGQFRRTPFERVDLEECQGKLPAGFPVVVSIDLDSFAGVDPLEAERRFSEVWQTIMAFPRLTAISFAISRPWLASDAEADRLVRLALQASLAVPTARVHFEPFGIEGSDRTERAKSYRRKNQVVPRFDLRKASSELRSLLVANADRLEVRLETEAWRRLLDNWRPRPEAGKGMGS